MPEPKGNLVTPIGIDAAGNLYALLVDAAGHLQIDLLSSALPAGAATAALQLADGHNVTVDNASIPVTGTFWQVTQPVSVAAAVTVNAGRRAGQIQRAAYNGVPGDMNYHTLATITANAVLLSIDFVSDHLTSRIRLTGANRLPLGPGAQTPEVWTEVVSRDLNDSGGESSLFKAGIYDDVNDYYSLFLKREIPTATSLTIEYRAGLATADVGIGITWVELT